MMRAKPPISVTYSKLRKAERHRSAGILLETHAADAEKSPSGTCETAAVGRGW